MTTSKLSPGFLAGIMLVLFFAVALCIRVCLPYDQVFSSDWVKFTGNDAYYHMRLVDSLAHNFPHLSSFDPYLVYPGGATVSSIHFFDLLLAGIIWVIGLGAPTQHTIDVVAVYFPAVLGALTVIPVYVIGREIFNRWVGILSAALMAVLPGEFLGRSILGFADQHVAETLFAATSMMFLVLAVKAARERGLAFDYLRQRNWSVISRPIIYSLLGGICLGTYLITWEGALLFVFIISAYFITQFIIDHLKRQSTDYLCIVGVVLFFIALVIYAPVGPLDFHLVSILIALLLPLALSAISRLMTSKEIKPAYYPLIIIGVGGVGLAIFYAIEYAIGSRILLNIFYMFPKLLPGGAELTTLEMQPLLRFGSNDPWVIAWGNFTTGFFLSLISLIALIYLVIKRGSAEKTLLFVWSLVILLATLAQRRFGYYFAVNVALLSAYLSAVLYYVVRFMIDYFGGKSTDYVSWQALELADFGELISRPSELATRAERKRTALKKGRGARFRLSSAHIIFSLWFIVVVFLAIVPNIAPATVTASRAQFAPSDAWCSSLSWMKENTPDPFDDPDFYYQRYESPLPGEVYQYPESAYGVTAWWDYGYWITRIAHRMPSANPGQDPKRVIPVANLLLTQDEASAQQIAKGLDSSYMIIDDQTAMVLLIQDMIIGKFGAVAIWAGGSYGEFFDVYYWPYEGRHIPLILYYPEYYRSLSSRLYSFDGKAVTPDSTMVISYVERTQEGTPYKVVTSAEQFDSYPEAEEYLLAQESANCRIVGTDPLVSAVPLEELAHYRLIYSSDNPSMLPGLDTLPAVKIFEYLD